ncbi:MAG: hypothetical protein M3O22_01420 [Pseudomonadota bacterium]|nr:hypothetical protein [Pseudomonadota bacterium]
MASGILRALSLTGLLAVSACGPEDRGDTLAQVINGSAGTGFDFSGLDSRCSRLEMSDRVDGLNSSHMFVNCVLPDEKNEVMALERTHGPGDQDRRSATEYLEPGTLLAHVPGEEEGEGSIVVRSPDGVVRHFPEDKLSAAELGAFRTLATRAIAHFQGESAGRARFHDQEELEADLQRPRYLLMLQQTQQDVRSEYLEYRPGSLIVNYRSAGCIALFGDFPLLDAPAPALNTSGRCRAQGIQTFGYRPLITVP